MALAPPNPYLSDGDIEIKPNKVMRTFYEIWEKCIDKVGRKPDVMAILGEPMDGDNFKQLGQQSWTTNFNDQVNASTQLLKMWDAQAMVMVRGSGYHVHRGATNYEEMVARKLGVKRYRAWNPESITIEKDKDKNKQPTIDDVAALTDYFANFRVNGKIFNIAHHIGFSKNEMYRTTAMARELVTMKLSEDLYPKSDVVARGHVHYHVRVGFTHTQGFTCPAWKLPDSHLYRHGLGGTKPDVGVVECIVEPNEMVLIRPIIEDIDLRPPVMDL